MQLLNWNPVLHAEFISLIIRLAMFEIYILYKCTIEYTSLFSVTFSGFGVKYICVDNYILFSFI